MTPPPTLHDRPDHSPGSSSTSYCCPVPVARTCFIHALSHLEFQTIHSCPPFLFHSAAARVTTGRTEPTNPKTRPPALHGVMPPCLYHTTIFHECILGCFNTDSVCRILVSTGAEQRAEGGVNPPSLVHLCCILLIDGGSSVRIYRGVVWMHS